MVKKTLIRHTFPETDTLNIPYVQARTEVLRQLAQLVTEYSP